MDYGAPLSERPAGIACFRFKLLAEEAINDLLPSLFPEVQDFAKHLPFIYIRCSQNPLPSQPRLLFGQEHNDEDAGNTNVTPNADSNDTSSTIFSPFRAAALASTIEERRFLCSLGSPALAEFFQSQNIDPSQMGNGALTFTKWRPDIYGRLCKNPEFRIFFSCGVFL